MSTKPIITKLPLVDLHDLQGYKRVLPTAFDESFTILEKINYMIHQFNSLGQITNDAFLRWNEVMEWILTDALSEQIINRLNDMEKDGRLGVLINGVLFGKIDDLINEVKGINFENYLEYQKVLYSMPTRLSGLLDFPQAFSINQSRNELYVVRQENSGAVGRISVYSTPDLTLKETKSFPMNGGSYQEGLPYYYNASNQLCFIIRPSYSGNVAIFNFATGVLGANITIEGSLKSATDKNRKYFLSHIGSANRTEGAHIYDFNSVVSGSPKLLKTVRFPNSVANGEKVQTMAIVNNKIVLGVGKSYPVITALDFNGTVLGSTEISKQSLGTLFAKHNPSINPNNYQFENEGVHFYDYNGVEIPMLLNIANQEIIFTLVGSTDFERLEKTLNQDHFTHGGVKMEAVSFAAGVSNYADDVAVMYGKTDDGYVELEGVCTHAYGGLNPNLTLFTLPYPFRPAQNRFFKTQASGGGEADNRITVAKNGQVVLNNTTSTSVNPFTVLDGIRFRAET